MANKRIPLATWPFRATGRKPFELLEQTGWKPVFNPRRRRLRPHDVAELLEDIDGVIASTEPYNSETLCNLTTHIEASARQTRHLMKLGAAEDCIRVLNGEQPNNDVLKDMLGCLRRF